MQKVSFDIDASVDPNSTDLPPSKRTSGVRRVPREHGTIHSAYTNRCSLSNTRGRFLRESTKRGVGCEIYTLLAAFDEDMSIANRSYTRTGVSVSAKRRLFEAEHDVPDPRVAAGQKASIRAS